MANMQAMGEELFSIIEKCYPELAPKLTGMIMSMGEEECVACLESQERLAERLDEAFRILDANGQCAKERGPEEKRIDPEDGKARTFNELRALCASRYTLQEIEDYWKTCTPVDGASTSAAAAPKAKAKAAASASSAKPTSSAPAAASTGAPPEAEGSGASAAPPPDEAVLGLTFWLRELKLQGYAAAAAEWAEEQGACSLEEIMENVEDFAEALGLKKLERKRLEQQGEATAKTAVEQAAAAAAAAPPAVEPAAAEPTRREEAAQVQRQLDEARQEQEELEREMEEMRAQEEAEAEARRKGRGPAAKASTGPAKPKAPSVRVAPKAPTLTREEIEWNRENEKQEREYQMKQQAKQKARDAEAAAQEAEEKRQARAREAQERQERAAAELAAKVAAAAPGAGEAAGQPQEAEDDFPALGGWAAAGGKKGRKKR